MKKICDLDKCTGCYACMNVCQKNAIHEGFLSLGKKIPVIDSEKCVDCGQCLQICPVLSTVAKQVPVKVYAACVKERESCPYSSSGGIADILARQTIRDRGVVFGVSAQQGDVNHILVEKEGDVFWLQGSKYVHSNTGYTFRETERRLKEGTHVLYIGMPCQIAGLKNYLKQDYDNLVTVDMVCHGAPPTKYLKEHLRNIKWSNLLFREGKDLSLQVFRSGKKVYHRSASCDLYYSAFNEGLSIRDNCYQCQYASVTRVSDITLGDFWGLDRSTLRENLTGNISLVMILSVKGMTLFEKCKDHIFLEEKSVADAVNEKQVHLSKPPFRHSERELFEQIYVIKGFDKAVAKTMLGKRVVRKYRRSVIKKIPGVKALIRIRNRF